MQYDFLIGHRVRINRVDEKGKVVKDDKSNSVFVVVRVIEFPAYEKIIYVKEDGNVGWVKKKKECDSDTVNKEHFLFCILDWDPGNPFKKNNNKKKNRFEMMDI